ncbi:phosphoribosylaminoimidazole carboxylase [Neolecta irregularis DAH-3]|uniref:Phosphoribosylaminoimidazole carboxylase n=1 Tax=Neolecta irregularis (strain DAH-3) TaxID=1198029 RepID=A0A1U7LR36_NEOID|nr:phosphoribosylaminoimidazole carboxylase [Neolecta irregularis DAH-3]|eukprot:OLL25088.1 phosphoribosylaminoimidazole carboxylase [Neolecta irregularis DAH-3]
MDSRTIGGGQLGRMLVEAANRLNIKTIILDAPFSPAKQINSLQHIDGSFSDPSAIKTLSSKCHILTTEIEHVDTQILGEIEKEGKVEVHPSSETIKIIQDKFTQKEHLTSKGLPTTQSIPVQRSRHEILTAGEQLGYPCMLKSRTLSYDGRGNFVVSSAESVTEIIKTLPDQPLYVEKWAEFEKELAVVVIRTTQGNIISYPTVETIHQSNICHLVYAPARVMESVQAKARIIAEKAISTFNGAGVFGVEMFLMKSGDILINEIAPRPHNSGHYTIEACNTSQYEAHIRAITGLPLPKLCTAMKTTSIMLNILGGETPDEHHQICRKALETPGATVHLYGKLESRKSRKMGHVTIVGSSMSECDYRLANILTSNADSMTNPSSLTLSLPVVSIIMGSDSDLPRMRNAANILSEFGIPFEITIVSAHRTPDRMFRYAREAAGRGIKVIIAGAGGAAHLPGMVAALTTLPVIGVPVELKTLGGVDSLHSIVQMPRGVPVATVAINNSTNAALLAIRMLGITEKSIRRRLCEFALEKEDEVLKKAEAFEQGKWQM